MSDRRLGARDGPNPVAPALESDPPPPPPQLSTLQKKIKKTEQQIRAAKISLNEAQISRRADLEAASELDQTYTALLVLSNSEDLAEGGVEFQRVDDLLDLMFKLIVKLRIRATLPEKEARVPDERSAQQPPADDQRDGDLYNMDELFHAVQTKVGSDEETPENTQNIMAAADNREQMIGDRDSMVGEFHVQRVYLQEQHGTVGATVGPQTAVREKKGGDKASKDGQSIDSVTNEWTVTGNHELGEQKQPMENLGVGARGMRGENPEEEGGQIHRSPINGAASAEPGVTPVQVMLDRSCRGSEGWRHDGTHAGISNEVRDMGAGWRGASWCRDREIGESFDGGGRIGPIPWGTTSHPFLIQCE